MKNEVKQCMCFNLASGLDPLLHGYGFTRKKNSLLYSREFADALQKIEITITMHPVDRPDSAAAVYPWLDVSIDAVDKLVMDMTGGDPTLLPGLTETTLRQPIEFTSVKAQYAKWFIFQPDSILPIVKELSSFIPRWTIPFLDVYSTIEGICELYEKNDRRVINDLAQVLRVTAAMVLCGRIKDAISVMDKWFGKPGPRRRYQRVFEYLKSLE